MQPELIERAGGGWLAISPPGEALRIGVTACNRLEAERRFVESERAWRRLLEVAALRPESSADEETT